MAAGTANANAHGHDTTSTASAAENARDGSKTLHTAAVSSRQRQHTCNEAAGCTFAGLCQLRTLRLCARHQGGDARQHGLGAHTLDAHLYRSIQEHAASNQRLAASPGHRCGLTTEQCFIDTTALAQQYAIGGKATAFLDVNTIADGELLNTDAFERTVGTPTVGERRRESGQRVRQIAGAMTCAHLQIAARQQEEHEHGH